jgi:NAD(P)H-dependent flavin oxidoreductase YrpB (nitropropane dioxygenase family)
MQCLGRGTEKSPRVRLVIVRGDQCGAPGAKSTIDKEFYTANSETLVETIVDKTRYLGAPVVIGGGIAHHVKLDLSQSVLRVSTIYVIKT